jgi:D-arabinose 1-dehydrogenase-like Zn-dependent alcohol dehydrogenase
MKAIVYAEYGPPDVLQFTEVAQPTPRDGEVLIRIRAASVNPLDWHYMRGTPYVVRTQAGLRKPKVARLGVDVAGQVEAVGKNVTQFQPGDEVFGACKGAFAEYVCASQGTLVLKPANVTFEQAAAVPVAAFSALQGLRDKGAIRRNGAKGAITDLDHLSRCASLCADLANSQAADRGEAPGGPPHLTDGAPVPAAKFFTGLAYSWHARCLFVRHDSTLILEVAE